MVLGGQRLVLGTGRRDIETSKGHRSSQMISVHIQSVNEVLKENDPTGNISNLSLRKDVRGLVEDLMLDLL